MTPPLRRALLVDDEPGAIADLRLLLERDGSVAVAGEAGDLAGAVKAVESLGPDLVFLDIQLGDRSGFELLDQVAGDFEVVFVTAYDQYAIRAFEVNALDYLLKPVDPERLRAALARSRPSEPRAEPAARPRGYHDWLFLAVGRERRFVRVSSISHITTAGDYTAVTTVEGRRFLVPTPIGVWEARLPRSHFLRIHRGALVNLEQVERVEPWSSHTFRVHLRQVAEPLPMSRGYARQAERRLG